jgi:transposase
MRVLHERCCGLDIHKRFVVACLLTTGADGTGHKEVRTFSAMTNELLALADWLRGEDCGPVVMESTGSYWRPVFNLLEGQCDVLVVNAYHAKAVPGRKTDVKEAEWLADLLRHGLLRASYIPAPAQRHLRDLTRYRIHLVDERARLTNRLQTVLEDANIKPPSSSPRSSPTCAASGAREILQRLLEGETDAQALAELARGRLRAKREALAQAVVGRLQEHHDFSVRVSSLPTWTIWMPPLRGWMLSSKSAWPLSRRPWRSCRPFPVSPGAPPKCSSLRSARTSRTSPRPSIWPPGRGCVLAMRRVVVDASAAGHAAATPGCGARWLKSPTLSAA